MMVGPYDLSGSMGLTAQFEHPDFLAALQRLRDQCRAHSIPMGLHIVQPDPDQLRAKIRDGYQFLAYGTDAVFLYHGGALPEDLVERSI